ncbi:MAG: nucleoside-diphosphate sugar epimerase [Sphingobacteriales bacterium]|nr:nucleoside-diphosphate sugar epimerase [Sphingobacteriales bacterium]
MSNKKVIILGASGLIGSELLTILLHSDAYSEVTAFLRKPLTVQHPKLKQEITSFDDLEELKTKIKADVIFCCLGSTKKKTPNLKDYKKVDHDIPLFFAKEGLTNHLLQFHLVSALGAKANSSNFYTHLKGEIEQDLKMLAIPSLFIYQPSFLDGDRKEKRPLEKVMLGLMKLINPLLVGSLKKYQSIKAKDIAKVMFNESIQNKSGIFVFKSDKIKELT